MKILCKYIGGSHSYGLATPESDQDVRGVFANTELNKVIGLDRFEHQDIKANGADIFYYELRHFLCLLRKTNVMVIEVLYNQHWDSLSDEFSYIQRRRECLIDSPRFYASLKGYLHNERRLFLGERRGRVGGKRREQIDQFEFSPKNAVQALRLCFAGETFFKRGYFPVNIREEDRFFAEQLMEIKLYPEKQSIERITEFLDQMESKLDQAFGYSKYMFVFNAELANTICLNIYGPIIEKLRWRFYYECLEKR